MTCDWTPMRAALARCRRDAVPVPFWWRDDDAVAPTGALDRLTALADKAGLPVHLAIIPAHATPALGQVVDTDLLVPVVHGWAHVDHAGGTDKKNEFLTPRPDAPGEAAQALTRMRDLFGLRLRAMFVPPWNRIGDAVTRDLPAQGYTALSTFGARQAAMAAPGLAQINTHIDPIWWKGTRDLVASDQLIAQTARHLDARRTGAEDVTEPLGLLTHHLVHTAPIWAFTAAFLDEMLTGGATPWEMEYTR